MTKHLEDFNCIRLCLDGLIGLETWKHNSYMNGMDDKITRGTGNVLSDLGVEGHEYVVYSRSNCPYCDMAKEFLEDRQIPYIVKDISDPENLKEMRTRYPDAKTVPQIFAGDKHIGGYDDLRKT